MKIGRPTGRNKVPLIATVSTSLADAVREVHRKTGATISFIIGEALEAYFKAKKIKLEVKF